VFDGVSLNDHAFHSPSLPNNPYMRQPSPGSTSSINGSHLEPPLSYDQLVQSNTALKTRVSELDLINDLFKGRVSELEQSEKEARRNEELVRNNEKLLRDDLQAAQAREAELKRKLEELEAELAEAKESGPRQKRMRLSDIVDESQASTPTSSTSNNGAS
jgi:GATA-binding protein, other eukaryote